MKTNRKIASVILVVIIAFYIVSFAKKKARILIVGDSISIGYTPFVKSHFANKADVVHNPGNAQHTGKGLTHIKEWIGDGKWDIVQINWGLWDLCYRHPDSKVQGKRDKIKGAITFEVARYKAQLDSIVSIIKQHTDAKIVFVTTSYVPTKEAGRYVSDPLKYNAVAKEVMKKHGVVVNDIYKKSIAIHKKYGKGNDDVHYEKKGYEKLSKLIIKFLEKEL